ncbi:MAG: winged helix-turn-helix domain-containing protein [Patescibacteria group bacterium]
MKATKTAKQLERYFKGPANHHRINIIMLLAAKPKLTLDQIVKELEGNTKTISEHTRRLAQAGLVNKKYQGNKVEHTLSPYGEEFNKFFKVF